MEAPYIPNGSRVIGIPWGKARPHFWLFGSEGGRACETNRGKEPRRRGQPLKACVRPSHNTAAVTLRSVHRPPSLADGATAVGRLTCIGQNQRNLVPQLAFGLASLKNQRQPSPQAA